MFTANFMHNHPKLEVTETSFNSLWGNKLGASCPHGKITAGDEKEQATESRNTAHLKCIQPHALWLQSCDIWKRQSYRDASCQIRDRPRLWEGTVADYRRQAPEDV